MKFFDLCRICLSEEKHTKMQPLFEQENPKCQELLKQIKECGGIEIKRHDEFPKQICADCLQKLEVCQNFRSMCQTSESTLLTFVIKSEPPGDTSDTKLPALSELAALEEHLLEEVETTLGSRKQLFVLVNSNDEESVDFIADEVFSPEALQANNDDSSEHTTPVVKLLQPIKLECDQTTEIVKRNLRSSNSSLQNMKTESHLHMKKQRGRKKLDPEQKQYNMCDICGNIYAKRSLLKMHLRRHLSEKLIQCEICNKTFVCPSEMRRHLRVHTGEKPYKCKFCGRTFGDRSSNIKHERIHTNTKPFSCTTCGKSFTYSNVLKNHMLTHTGEKPYSCLQCRKTFSRKHQLEQHYLTLIHQQTAKSLLEKKSSISSTIAKLNDMEKLLVTTHNSNVQLQQSALIDNLEDSKCELLKKTQQQINDGNDTKPLENLISTKC